MLREMDLPSQIQTRKEYRECCWRLRAYSNWAPGPQPYKKAIAHLDLYSPISREQKS